jgi:chemotaxis family two-component system sensor kinase Cph1
MSLVQNLPLKGLRVLVVEDHPALAKSLHWALESFGCRVVGPAQDEPTAQRLVEREEIDAAILDIDLHGTTSADLALRLRSVSTPFVFITGGDEAELLPVELRAACCLRKPVDPELLAETLLAEMASSSARPGEPGTAPA